MLSSAIVKSLQSINAGRLPAHQWASTSLGSPDHHGKSFWDLVRPAPTQGTSDLIAGQAGTQGAGRYHSGQSLTVS